MNKEFHTGNRKRLYEGLKSNSLLVLFSGTELRKTNDEYYPFYTCLLYTSDSSSRFTVLPLFQSFQSETEDTLWAWAQVALTHFLRSEERILLSEGSCSVLSYPLLEGPYPLCGSFGLPEEDGSFYLSLIHI